jgi:transcriptional regulator with XRE-family HTH domain
VDAYRRERAARLKRFGATLRALRIEKFGSQEAFALEAHMNRVHVQYLETGKREPELATLLILADALGVSLDRLAEGLAAPRERRTSQGRQQ